MTLMDKPKNAATIAKWGAACSPCALAKAKCIRSSNVPSARCDRCERLEKDCVSQVHKPRKKRQSRPSKTAQLEERLNNLVDFIKANNTDVPTPLRQVSGARQLSPYLGEAEGSTQLQRPETDPVHGKAPTPALGINNEPVTAALPIPNSYNERAPRICVCRAPAGEVPIPLEPDETNLSIYIDKLMPNYPFVPIPSGTTASELASRRPFLFSTIQMVSSYRNIKSMRVQNYFILKHISEHMLMRSERSFEILQSILLVLGYYHYHCMIHAQMNNLIGLANSLAADLGINRNPDLQERARLLQTNPEAPPARTNDERRMLCGVWYMTSIIALAFQRIDPPRYTPYIDQCLGELEADQEYESDLLLVQLVRIQNLSERIAQLHAKDHTTDELNTITRAPATAYSNMFHAELEKFTASLPPNLAANHLITCHINTAKLRLWEPPRIDAALLEKISNSLASLSLDSASSLDIFYRANTTLKSWFEFWLSIDVTDYFVLPMPVSAQLINAVTMLARWSKLSSPDCSKLAPNAAASAQMVRNDPGCSGAALVPVPALRTKDIDPAIPSAVHVIRTHLLSQPELHIDVPGILQAMASRFEQAQAASQKQGGLPWENDTWEMAAKKIKGTRLKLERWAELVAAADSERRKPGSSTGAGVNGGQDLNAGQGMDGNWNMESTVDVDGQPPYEEWSPRMSWANDFFEGLGMDQNFFFEGPVDYGASIMTNFQVSGGSGGYG
ncbi:uncharacterized protein GGS22DRAFT_176700 [Annulohypoxylon maeteangense]|uniref:uncharacterized protein n=1 Tax=Annulohypoxylon maeteangense TaxID=1927788 RepID=UPI0020078E33|nr:uncharacterized protein GGS22DRAFT_176700 [Annulohypoxylon maeteangense]KAI0879816.1 hypothetical protein GGS22DRAFT_176700 [Annulohypoxylon maeteangense]